MIPSAPAARFQRPGLALAVALALASCATPTDLTLAPVGPASGSPLPDPPTQGRGALVVYNLRRTINDGGISFERYTPYVIYDVPGRKVLSVSNHVGSMDQKPATVPLPAGRYFVYAQAEGYGRVRVPVVIVPSQLTEVYLTFEGRRPASLARDPNWVRLPEGPVVGRRADWPSTPDPAP